MYQLHHDIFTKLTLYASVIIDFKEDIKEVRVWNEIVELFGRRHCRVHVDIIIKEDCPYKFRVMDAKTDKFRYFDNDYFSFYLGPTGYRREEEELDNKEENTHYDYIWNLLAWMLRRENIIVQAERFISERMEYNEEKKRREQITERLSLIAAATTTLQPQAGQLIAVKNWSSSPLRLGLVNKVVLPTRKQGFSAELSELKKDLVAGKIGINLYSLDKICAIVNPAALPPKTTKPQLILWIETNENFEALIWRRPQELWG